MKKIFPVPEIKRLGEVMSNFLTKNKGKAPVVVTNGDELNANLSVDVRDALEAFPMLAQFYVEMHDFHQADDVTMLQYDRDNLSMLVERAMLYRALRFTQVYLNKKSPHDNTLRELREMKEAVEAIALDNPDEIEKLLGNIYTAAMRFYTAGSAVANYWGAPFPPYRVIESWEQARQELEDAVRAFYTVAEEQPRITPIE